MSGYNVELIMGGSEAKKQSDYSDRLLNGSLHAIIGTKVIKENYNIPPLDTLHLIYPNFGVESEEQMTGRIRRYLLNPRGEPLLDQEGNPLHKNQPLIRIYTVDANNTIPEKSKQFRRAFYKKMHFEELTLTPENSTMIEIEKETLSKSLKDW
jgi:superfamily II DNA or RNA helicase